MIAADIEFTGRFLLDRPLSLAHYIYLVKFNDTRRMRRDDYITAQNNDVARHCAGISLGIDAGYYVGGSGERGQEHDGGIVDYNGPPRGQPSLWCQWRPSEDRLSIEWDGGAGFDRPVEWLTYIRDKFLSRWNYTMNGTVLMSGDRNGVIRVRNNIIELGE